MACRVKIIAVLVAEQHGLHWTDCSEPAVPVMPSLLSPAAHSCDLGARMWEEASREAARTRVSASVSM